MNNFEGRTINEILRIFRSKKVLTIGQIAEHLKKSIPTARNRLKQWNAITSYNKNGRYYTLPDIPNFDNYGLWGYKKIHFSRYGNLKRTLIHVVENSSTGLDGTTIGKLLGLDPRSFLSHYTVSSILRRKKISGKFIYFSSEEVQYEKQIKEYIKNLGENTKSPLPDSVGITVLVEKIKRPKISLEKLIKRLQNKGLPVNKTNMQDFFVYHGLQKKTLDLCS